MIRGVSDESLVVVQVEEITLGDIGQYTDVTRALIVPRDSSFRVTRHFQSEWQPFYVLESSHSVFQGTQRTVLLAQQVDLTCIVLLSLAAQ